MIAVITDVHLGNHRRFGGKRSIGLNERAWAVITALEAAYNIAQNAGCDSMLIAGDAFDEDKPSPALIAEFAGIIGQAGIPTTILVGNHDRTSEDEHALLPLTSHALVISSPTTASPWVYLPVGQLRPGLTLAESYDLAIEQLRRNSSKSTEYLAVHSGIIDDSTPPFLRDETKAVPAKDMFELMAKHDISVAVCGDWHEHKVWRKIVGGKDRIIVQLGALVPTGFDNPGMDSYGKVLLLPSNPGEKARMGGSMRIAEVAGPRFLRVSYEEELDALVSSSVLTDAGKDHTVYLSVRVLPDNVKHAREDLHKLKEAGMIQDYTLTISGEFIKAQTHAAATRVKSSASFYDAIDAYLRVTPLPEGVSRAGVTDKIRSLMQQTTLR